MVPLNNLINFLPQWDHSAELTELFFTLISCNWIPDFSHSHQEGKRATPPIFPLARSLTRLQSNRCKQYVPVIPTMSFFEEKGHSTLLVGFLGMCRTLKHRANKNIIWSFAQELSYRLLLLKHKVFVEQVELLEAEFIFVRADFLWIRKKQVTTRSLKPLLEGCHAVTRHNGCPTALAMSKLTFLGTQTVHKFPYLSAGRTYLPGAPPGEILPLTPTTEETRPEFQEE